MIKGKVLVCSCFMIGIMLISNGEVSASGQMISQDSSELFALYNKEEEREYQDALSNYNKLKEEYEEFQEDINGKEVFNKLYDEAKEKQEDQVNNMEEQIDELLSLNKQLADKISEDIGKNWEHLFALDNQYKINLDKIELIIEEMNSLNLVEKKDVNYQKLDSLELEIQEQTSKFEMNDESEISILGDVTNVRFPLNANTIVTSAFGERIDPLTGNTLRFHSGLDLRAQMGTEVISIFNGVVEDVGFGALGGYYVKINHGNQIISYYCHLSEILCEKNQKITQYDVIALSGNSGSRTTGPHLHFGLYLKGNPVDPGILFE